MAQPVPSGQGSMTKNAGKSKSQGIEFEANMIVTNNLQFWTSFGYTEAKFTEYINTANVDLSGNLIPNVPKFTFGIGADYSIDFNDSFIKKAHFNLSYQHMGKMYWEEENIDYQKSYGITNAKITFVTSAVDFGFWGKKYFRNRLQCVLFYIYG